MTDKKYTLIQDDFIELANGVKLYRIMALRDILSKDRIVLAGQKGGYVESERNLSHKGNGWIFEGCIVRGSAFVCMDAVIKGKSEIWGEAYISGKSTINNSIVCDNIVVADECNVNNCVLAGDRALCGARSYDGVKANAKKCVNQSVLFQTKEEFLQK